MKIVIAGGSGFIGRRVLEKLISEHHEILLLSRSPDKTRKNFPSVRVQFWDAKNIDFLKNTFEETDAVINLIGESIASKRWTNKQKQIILASRIDSTRAIVTAIGQTNRRPSVLVNASAVGYYGDTSEEEVTETHPKGKGFLADVCEKWEGEALKAEAFNVRVVLLRTGIVLDRDGGVLQKLLLPFRFFVGGHLGTGKQWFPWIHLEDEAGAVVFSMKNSKISGPINLSAPEQIRMSEFCKTLGNVIHRPSFLHVPSYVLKLLLGEMAESLLLSGQRLFPKKLTEAGFIFKFPGLQQALKNILGQ